MVEMLATSGKPLLAQQLHDFTGLVCYTPPELHIRIMRPLPGEFSRDLAMALKSLTGESWQVVLSEAEAVPSLLEQARNKEESARAAILAEPMVAAALANFPGAELIDYEIFEQRSVSI
jgi:DNA polymerase III subunit gamma/tau